MTTVPDKPLADPGGPMIGICAGGRCSALWRLRSGSPPDADPFDTTPIYAVRQAIASTPGGVLTRLECMGACAQAPVIGVADRRPDSAATGQVSWVVGADTPDRQAGLLSWIAADWTTGPPAPPDRLLPSLFRMVRATPASG